MTREEIVKKLLAEYSSEAIATVLVDTYLDCGAEMSMWSDEALTEGLLSEVQEEEDKLKKRG